MKYTPHLAVGLGLLAALALPLRVVDRISVGFLVIAAVFTLDILRMLVWWR